MGIFILVLILILILILIYVFGEKTPEHFDNKITNMKEDTCANLCVKIAGCNGFAFDSFTNTCWLSKLPIFEKPLSSLYALDYNKDYLTCNKEKILPDPVIASSNDFKLNSTFKCKSGSGSGSDPNLNPTQYRIYDSDSYYKLDSLGNTGTGIPGTTDTITTTIQDINIKPYPIYKVEWPISIEQKLTSSDLEYILLPETNVALFEEKPDEYLGQYVFEHKCVANTSKNDCMQTCKSNKTCVGVEFNPGFEQNGQIYKNVCCPKRIIKKIVPRKESKSNGKFYLKKTVSRLALENSLKNKNIIMV